MSYTLPTDLASVPRDYTRGIVRRDVARNLLADALIAPTYVDHSGATVPTDAPRVAAVMAAMRELAAASLPTASRARVLTANDYADAIASRVATMRAYADTLARGAILPLDVPPEMAASVRSILTDDASPIVGRVTHGGDIADAATARAIGNRNCKRHYALAASGAATIAGTGEPFAPTVGRVYPFSVIAGLTTTEYPLADLSDGAAAAPFVGDGRRGVGTRWTFVNNVSIDGYPRASRGVRFNG